MFEKVKQALHYAGSTQNRVSGVDQTSKAKNASETTMIKRDDLPTQKRSLASDLPSQKVSDVDAYDTWFTYGNYTDDLGKKQPVKIKLIERGKYPDIIEGQFVTPNNADALDNFETDKLRDNGLVETEEDKRRKRMIAILSRSASQQTRGKPLDVIRSERDGYDRHADLTEREYLLALEEKQREEKQKAWRTQSVHSAQPLVPETERKIFSAFELNPETQAMQRKVSHEILAIFCSFCFKKDKIFQAKSEQELANHKRYVHFGE